MLQNAQDFFVAQQEIENTAKIGTFEVNFITKKTKWSPALYTQFEIPPTQEALFGNAFWKYVHEQDINKTKENFEKIHKSNDWVIFEYRIVVNTQVKFISIKAKKVCDNNHHIIGICGTSWDITEQRVTQNNLQKTHEDVIASINYAQRIQKAVLPSKEDFDKYFSEYFIYYQPRDIVSGDFYWITHHNYKTIVVAGDCTGHGIPGAFMSMVANVLLNEIVNLRRFESPEKILEELHKGVQMSLRQKETKNNDGMDISICVIHQFDEDDGNMLKVEFAGANNPLYYFKNGEFIEIKANLLAIGGTNYYTKETGFSKKTLYLEKGSALYMFSDGYQDQFGGERNSRFMSKRFKQLLIDIHEKNMQEQHQIVENTIQDWIKNTRQIDDMLVMGIRI
jgi:serine phosphatase RsbU (regulator of sigma subunit)